MLLGIVEGLDGVGSLGVAKQCVATDMQPAGGGGPLTGELPGLIGTPITQKRPLAAGGHRDNTQSRGDVVIRLDALQVDAGGLGNRQRLRGGGVVANPPP